MSRRSWIPSSVAFCAALLLGIALLTAPSTSSAYSLYGISARVGATNPEGVDGTLVLGAGLDFQQYGNHFHLLPNVHYWDENGLTDVNPNFDVLYHFEPFWRVSPYLGAGVGMHFYSSDGPGDPDDNPSLNLSGGILFPLSGVSLFVEGRAIVTERDQWGFLSGATFNLGR